MTENTRNYLFLRLYWHTCVCVCVWGAVLEEVPVYFIDESTPHFKNQNATQIFYCLKTLFTNMLLVCLFDNIFYKHFFFIWIKSWSVAEWHQHFSLKCKITKSTSKLVVSFISSILRYYLHTDYMQIMSFPKFADVTSTFAACQSEAGSCLYYWPHTLLVFLSLWRP